MKRFLILNLFALICILASSCGSTETVPDGDSSDGDNATATECASQNDCDSGYSCIKAGEKHECALICTSSAECQSDYPGGCCNQIGTASFCRPLLECSPGDSDDDEPTIDGDKSETDAEPESCQPDTYSCDGADKVVRCTIDGQWTIYKHCGADSCCANGNCVNMEGELNCDLGEDCQCATGSYRCRGAYEIQKCKADCSDWEFYKDCDGDKICSDGFCKALGGPDPDGDSSTDGDIEDVCTPCNLTDGCSEDGQYCLAKQGETDGCCRLFCDTAGGYCPFGMKCKNGTCQDVEGYCTSDAECDLDQFCDKIPGKEGGMCTTPCYEQGQRCPKNTKCDENPASLNYGKCIYDGECITCSADQQCVQQVDQGHYCNITPGYTEGCCMEMCGSSDDCKGAMTCCPDGRCGVNCGMECDKQCGPGFTCDPLYNECVYICPSCPPDECCNADTGYKCMESNQICPCDNPVMCGMFIKPCCWGWNCSAIIYGVLGYCIQRFIIQL